MTFWRPVIQNFEFEWRPVTKLLTQKEASLILLGPNSSKIVDNWPSLPLPGDSFDYDIFDCIFSLLIWLPRMGLTFHGDFCRICLFQVIAKPLGIFSRKRDRYRGFSIRQVWFCCQFFFKISRKPKGWKSSGKICQHFVLFPSPLPFNLLNPLIMTKNYRVIIDYCFDIQFTTSSLKGMSYHAVKHVKYEWFFKIYRRKLIFSSVYTLYIYMMCTDIV